MFEKLRDVENPCDDVRLRSPPGDEAPRVGAINHQSERSVYPCGKRRWDEPISAWAQHASGDAYPRQGVAIRT